MDLTIKDIARLAGVSPTAVSFVLNNKAAGNISPEKQRLVAKIVRQHGYKQNRTAKGLILRRSYRIAVCYSGPPDVHPWFGEASHHLLINHIASRLHQTDYGIDLIEASPHPSLGALGERLLAQKADGFLFINYNARRLEKLAFLLTHNKVPIISAGTPILTGDIDWVAVDREKSFERLLQYVVSQSLTRVGFLDTDLSKTYSAMKKRVFERFMNDNRLDAAAIGTIDVFKLKAIAKTVADFITKYPNLEGIVITDNGLAHIVQMIIAERPIKLFGFGDDIFVSLCEPPIPYMKLPMHQLAQAAVEQVLHKIEHPGDAVPLKTYIPCELVV